MLKAIINEAGCVILADKKNFTDCIEYCTIVQEETEYSRGRKIELWRAGKSKGQEFLLLPRAGFWPARERLEVEILLPMGRPVTYNFTGQLWESKRMLIEETLGLLRAYGGATLQIDTGMGKSKVTTYVTAQLGVEALYVVKNRALKSQAIRDAVADLGQDPASKTPKPFGVTVVIINSLARDPQRYFHSGIGLVVYDEAREYCSDVFSRVFALCPARYILALGADTLREDGLSKRLYAGVGPLYAPELNKKDFSLTVRVYRYENPPEYSRVMRNSAGKPSLSLSLEQFMGDFKRTELVVECVRIALQRPDANMFAMASRCDLLQLYHDAVCAELDVGKVAIITEDTPEAERDCAFATARLIFGTYEILGVGINIRRMTDIGFFTTRKARIKQFTGRVLRQDSDATIERFVYDIVDEGLWFRSHFDKRMEVYDERGAVIEECLLPI